MSTRNNAASRTVYCYDRHATAKRLAALVALLLAGAGLFLAAGSAEAAEAAARKIERLPTVVVHVKTAKPVRLPTVVVEGRRTPETTMVATAEPRLADARR